MRARTAVAATIGLAALVLSPFYAFSGPGFQYGAEELRTAIEGTWQIALPDRAITLAIAQGDAPARSSRERGVVRSAAACTKRTLVRDAGACGDFTRMPLAVTLVGGLPAETKPTGELIVVGDKFAMGELDVELGAGSYVKARISPTGAASDVRVRIGDQVADDLPMVRVPAAGK